MPTVLSVAFAEKDAVKALGARWDAATRAWVVPDGVDPAPFAKWLPAAAPLVKTASDALEHLTLSAYLGNASAIVQRQLGNPTWIVAEVAESNLRGPHLYIEIAETSPTGQVVAKVRANALGATSRSWFKEFVSVVGEAPARGMRLLLQVSCSLHPLYGFQLSIHAIDSAFTVGEFSRRIAKIRAELEGEGVLRRQDALPMPTDFTRVAIIAPPAAAGLGDFQRDADQLQALGLVQFQTYNATFQGDRTEAEILAALAAVATDHVQSPFDALVVLRGGGSQLDLDYLNNLSVARVITAMPLPVFTAIGHERDHVALDEVSRRAFDTPSKAIAFIRNTLVQRATEAARDLARIEQTAAARIQRAQAVVQSGWQVVDARSRNAFAVAAQRASHSYAAVVTAARSRLDLAGHRIGVAFHTAGQAAHARLQLAGRTIAEGERRVAMRATRAVQAQGEQLQRVAAHVARVAENAIRTRESAVQRTVDRVERLTVRHLNVAAANVQQFWHAADRADPVRILSRGYAVITRAGKAVTSAGTEPGEVVIRWRDGERRAVIE